MQRKSCSWKEYLSPILPAKKPKKVLVIGGGMAGMAFAKMAEEKGHDVTLLESTSELEDTCLKVRDGSQEGS